MHNATRTSPPSVVTEWQVVFMLPVPLAPWLYAIIAFYLLIVRVLRHRRIQALDREYAKISKLTPAQAQKMIQVPLTLDLPYLTGKAQAFALFKTYGIPTISTLLHRTKQLGRRENSSRRYMDTGVLISTWATCPLSGPGSGARCPVANDEVDPRSAIAVARTNWLHAHYPSISNNDFLYTLSVFIYEPVKWAERFEWRSLSLAECEALYVFWAEIGRRMGIKDIPSSFEEFREWSEAYERDYMLPDEINAIVAEQTIALVLHKVPDVLGLKSFGRQIVICMLEDRLRQSMLMPPPPPLLKQTLYGILHVRAFFIRNFCLPRVKPVLFIIPDAPVTSGKGDSGPPRAHPQFYDNDPWYYPESTGFRKLLEKAQIAVGLARRDDFPGPHFGSDGYRLEEIGPKAFTKLDHEKVMKMAEQIQGTPVMGPWSLDYAVGCPMKG